jgi:hypothetical protein
MDRTSRTIIAIKRFLAIEILKGLFLPGNPMAETASIFEKF